MLPLQLKSAATDGDLERLGKQLSRVSGREKDEENNTGLHYAAWGGHLALCRQFLNAKADVNALNDDGYSPLHLAARYGRLETVKYLLDNGADLHAIDKIGCSCLHLAAEANWGVTGWEGSGGKKNFNAEVCRLLLLSGADPLLLDSFGRSPLDVASSDPEIQGIMRAAVQTKKRSIEEVKRREYLERAQNPGFSSSPSSSPAPSAPSNFDSFDTKNPEDWTRHDVSKWLAKMGLERYGPIFEEKAINGRYILKKMTEEKLAHIVSDEFHRERIMDEIEDLRNTDFSALGKKREAEDKARRARDEMERRLLEEKRERAEKKREEMRSLKSSESTVPTRVTFENNTGGDLRILWVDQAGEGHLKKFLSPSETYSVDTYVGHVWQIFDDRTGDILRAEIASREPIWVSAKNDELSLGDLPSYDQVAGDKKY